MAQESWTGPNDRRKRREVRHVVTDVVGAIASIPVRVLDVSPSGLGLQSNQPLKVGKSYPVALSAREVTIEVLSTAKWCRMSVTKGPDNPEGVPVYGVGLKFENVTAEQVARLEKLVGRALTVEPAAAPAASSAPPEENSTSGEFALVSPKK